MASQFNERTAPPRNSIRSVLQAGPVIAYVPSAGGPVIEGDDDELALTGSYGHRGGWNNLALGNLTFKHEASQLISSTTGQALRVGDVCVRLMDVASQGEDYSSLVDLYNTYVVKGSSLMARRCINGYLGMEELCLPAIPIHTFVSEWNTSLRQFVLMVRHDERGTRRERRLRVVSNVTELTLSNVPALSDHLWFVVHCIVSEPSLVRRVLQLVGSVASGSSGVYQTGEVEGTTVPDKTGEHPAKLYLVAKTVPTSPDVYPGVTLGLFWVDSEDELHDHLRNCGDCYYVHIGTDSGNTFRCNGFCEWRYYNYGVFSRMIRIGETSASRFTSTGLAGDTGDSARQLDLP